MRLSGKARKGRADAFGFLLQLANYAIAELDALAHAQPELMKSYAFDCPAWPVRLPCSKPHAERVFDRIANEWEVGRHLAGQNLSLNQSRFDMFAYLLASYMRMLRTPGLDVSHLPDAEVCRKLPRLSEDTLDEWWQVARRIFNRSYPDLDELDIQEVQRIKEYEEFKGDVRAKFVEQIRRRFCKLAFTAASAGEVLNVVSQNAPVPPSASRQGENSGQIAREDFVEDPRSDDFDLADLRDPSLLLRKLNSQRDEVSKYLWSVLSKEMRERVKTYAASSPDELDDLVFGLLAELNVVIRGVLLYSEKCFQSVKFPAELLQKAKRPPIGNKDVRVLNRRILEAAFPDVFVPRARQRKH